MPVFVRMEYLRGVILNLIEMWCLIRESVTVQDAFIDWSQKMRQERKLKVILMTVPHWLGGQEDWQSKDVTLRRLGDLVLRMIRDFDEAYPRPPDDPLACVLGRLDIPRQGYDDDLLLDFYQRFTAVQEGVPDCRLCDFRKAQRQRLRRRGDRPDQSRSAIAARVQPRLRPPVGAGGRGREHKGTRSVVQLVRAAGRHDHCPPGRARRHGCDGRFRSPGRTCSLSANVGYRPSIFSDSACRQARKADTITKIPPSKSTPRRESRPTKTAPRGGRQAVRARDSEITPHVDRGQLPATREIIGGELPPQDPRPIHHAAARNPARPTRLPATRPATMAPPPAAKGPAPRRPG